ncbi:unnamed protein product [Sphenostylis stenocarpa]|uniref:non-specific serine/threonine protein kinase n=1 Tax=Sphenostylis stenocarpa TaxID=92480 RepID=A0AA86VSH0_9FABA|nr:unnamed protein product [Sphenostylis stenocarpa]
MERVIGGKYKIGKKIGSGSFGEIHIGAHIETCEMVAIKMILIPHNYEIEGGFPRMKWCGTDGDNNVLVIELLGPSLEDFFFFCGSKLSLKTVLMLADQMLARIEYLHSKGFLHRDIKPDNFLMGLGKKANQTLCKSYPVEFASYFHYCRSLTFDQLPDYGLLKRLFRNLFTRAGWHCMAPLAVPTSIEPVDEDNHKGNSSLVSRVVNGSTQIAAETPSIKVDHQRVFKTTASNVQNHNAKIPTEKHTVNNGSSMSTAMPRVSTENVSKPVRQVGTSNVGHHGIGSKTGRSGNIVPSLRRVSSTKQ